MLKQNNTEITFQIQRVYTKDIYFEAPDVPHIFQKNWYPGGRVDLNMASSTKLIEDMHEVLLRMIITASLEEETLFLCEVHQSGIFIVCDIEESQIAHCLVVHYPPDVLFLYAREFVTSLISRGTLPQLNLAPINFEALFINYLQQQDGEGVEQHQGT